MAEQSVGWTFLSNHAHVLVCLARDPELRLREIAELVGITERAASSIIADLEEAGYLTRVKTGRRNTYKLHLRKPLRHPLEKNHRVGDLIEAVSTDQ
jgi:DNA-binding MarR family transcriptional regulator